MKEDTNVGMWGDYKCKRWEWWGNPGKVLGMEPSGEMAGWRSMKGLRSMGMGIHAYGGYTRVWWAYDCVVYGDGSTRYINWYTWVQHVGTARAQATLNMIFKCHKVLYVTIVPYRMTLLMNKWTCIVMDDGYEFTHWPKPYLLLSATCGEILS